MEVSTAMGTAPPQRTPPPPHRKIAPAPPPLASPLIPCIYALILRWHPPSPHPLPFAAYVPSICLVPCHILLPFPRPPLGRHKKKQGRYTSQNKPTFRSNGNRDTKSKRAHTDTQPQPNATRSRRFTPRHLGDHKASATHRNTTAAKGFRRQSSHTSM